MPIITLYYDDLEQLTGVDKESIIRQIPMIGSDIERVEEDHIDIEFFPNRPDLYSVEGVARAMRNFIETDLIPKKYTTNSPSADINLSGKITQVRPHIACAIVKDITFTPHSIESLMNLQESLHWGIGRNRKKASIGVHDLSRITPPFTYTTVPPGFSFTPLDFSEPMTMQDILEKHPKGVKFAHLLKGTQQYPLIHDAENRVLSFPPIINSEHTRVTEDTTQMFVEVTGLDHSAVNNALNIVTTVLADRGASLHAVQIKSGHESVTTPDLSSTKKRIEVQEVEKLLGIQLSGEEISHALNKMGFATILSEGTIEVEVPPYRNDILHSWDLIEDVAIGYGYENFPARLPKTSTTGSSHKTSRTKDLLREIMIGLGYLEVMPFTLTSEKVNFHDMCRPETDDVVYVENPISEDYTMLRTTLLPGLLKILAANQHHELPQKIFEVGDVVKNNKIHLHMAAASIHPKANYTEAKSLIDAIMREQGITYTVSGSKDPAYIPNRCADIRTSGETIGNFGELHPQAIQNFGLENPIITMEIEIRE